jgi:hypothetical protein
LCLFNLEVCLQDDARLPKVRAGISVFADASAIIFLQEKIKMNTFRRLLPCVALGLTLALAGATFAQTATQSGDNKVDSCCCSDSCPMMKDGAMKNHATSSDKAEGCGCCGDSCPMMKKDGMKNHATSTGKDCCGCCGDSCSMMKKDARKHHAISSDKHECCCGDSCSMMKDGAKKDAAAKSDQYECCGGGDSCNMKDMKTKT